jgi:PAT family beta-lactamase induction signal transducer AmpG
MSVAARTVGALTPRDALPPGRLLAWVGVVYVASGAPYAIATDAVPAAYRDAGVDLRAIGLLALVELAWIVKALWAPLVDRLGRRRDWARAAQAATAATLLGLAVTPPDAVGPAAWALLLLLSAASATQDLALDAWTVGVVPPERLGPANGIRTSAWRVGALLGSGPLLYLLASAGWATAWRIAAVVFAAFAVVTTFLPEPRRDRATRPPAMRQIGEALRGLLLGRLAWAFLLFVFLFKIGDYAMARMTKPALLDAGITLKEVGTINSLSIVCVVLGALLGGLLTARWGMFPALWRLGLLQAVSNLGYASAAALGGPEPFWGAALLESFCSGLGTAPFLAFLMASCRREHAATQFALLTALMALARVAAGAASGYAASDLGYAPWFTVTFLLALPAFVLLPAVRRRFESTR